MIKTITVGREKGNTIVISDRCVSCRHLEMTQDDFGNIQIIDLNSTNGTFVNGRKLTSGESVYLSPEDIVRIGNTPLPWKNYFVEAEKTIIESNNKNKKRKKRKEEQERKPIKWRSVLSIVMAVFSLMSLIMMFLRMFKVI
jgi:pSer/pThr/pTyr-binding forkhead associated (FHA) protein